MKLVLLQFIKNIVEKKKQIKPITINVGSFQTSSTTGGLLEQIIQTKVYVLKELY